MRALSFRLKLLLAMMLVVAGATSTALYISQKQVEATYQKRFEEQSKAQIEFFADLQEARLGTIKEKCVELVKSVRLQAALREADVNDATNLYQVAGDELRLLRNLTSFAFFDAQGHLLRPLVASRRARFYEQRISIGKILSESAPQQIGMAAIERDDNRWQLHEVITTKVLDPVTQDVLGALVLAVPVPGLFNIGTDNSTAAATNRNDAIQSGIWLDGTIFSRSDAIPEDRRADLAKTIADHLKRSKPGTARIDFSIWPDTDPHRVFLVALTTGSSLPAAYQVCLYSLAESFHDQKKLELRILISGGVALLGALLISLILTHGLAVPLRELVAGTNEIRRGNFDVKVRVRSRDDIGRLAGSFNEMAEGLALKEKYRTVLNLVSDEKVAQQLINNQAALGGELREVSAIFCDVRGFTALTQNMPPEEVIDMLNEHMAVLARVVKENNGVVDKFVGDALMAIFGAPVSHEHDALDAAKCALSLVVEREKLNETSKHKLRIGVGLATGKMVAGCMGSTDRLNYTVLGERVNLAARLCSQAKAGQVIIDQTTRERLGDVIAVNPLPELQLKGFSESIVAYELRRAGDVRLGSIATEKP
jgi:class 3 adenylate cyclase